MAKQFSWNIFSQLNGQIGFARWHENSSEQSHVIIAVNGIGAKEAKQTSRTIPIIVVIEADPVGSGLIESLSRPGGNCDRTVTVA